MCRTPGEFRCSFPLMLLQLTFMKMSREPRRTAGSRLKQNTDDVAPAVLPRQRSRLTTGEATLRPRGVEKTLRTSIQPPPPSLPLAPYSDPERSGIRLSAEVVPQPLSIPVDSTHALVLDSPSPASDHGPGDTRLNSSSPEAASEYWYALSWVGGVFHLGVGQYVLQDWDSKAASLKVCAMTGSSDLLADSLHRSVDMCMCYGFLGARTFTAHPATVLHGRRLASVFTRPCFMHTSSI